MKNYDWLNAILCCICMPLIFLCGDPKTGQGWWWQKYTQWIVIIPAYALYYIFKSIVWGIEKIWPPKYHSNEEPSMRSMLIKIDELSKEDK